MSRRHRSRNLGWLAVLSAFVWIYFDYQKNFLRAVLWGWITIGLTVAHIATVRR